jgi:hypothetical protein
MIINLALCLTALCSSSVICPSAIGSSSAAESVSTSGSSSATGSSAAIGGRDHRPDNAAYTGVDISPASIILKDPFASSQLLATGQLADGARVDLTGSVEVLSVPDFLEITPSLLLRPIADGSGTLRLRAGGQTFEIPVQTSGSANPPAPDFELDVQPILTRIGCNAGTCHGSAQGKDGFFLSLRGYDAPADHLALTDDLAGRRVNLAAPKRSLFLQKPTGAVPHLGGQVLDPDSSDYALLLHWVNSGAPFGGETRALASIRVEPSDPTIPRAGGTQQFRVLATYADGAERDVTAHAFLEPGDIEILSVDDAGRATALRRGEAPILVRYHGQYTATTVFVLGDREGWTWDAPPTNNFIDERIHAKLQRVRVSSAGLCDDADFLRRIHFDLTGEAPTPAAVRTFLLDTRETTQKRDEVIERLLGSAAYVRHWTNRWCDLLQVNSKYLGATGAEQLREWIRAQVASNTPYDEFVAAILGTNGTTQDAPPSAYYRITREPDLVMENTTQLFLGVRFSCNKCHDHPFERWTQKQHWGLAAYFSQVTRNTSGAPAGDETIADKLDAEFHHPDTKALIHASFPYEVALADELEDDASQREQLVHWMTAANNPYFAKSYVNRLWGYMMGRGLIEPIDDIRAGNPATHPELLDQLTEEFLDQGFDVRHILRLICSSRTYQLALTTDRWNADDSVNYSHARARRLPAEVMFDTIHRATGSRVEFSGQRPGTMAANLVDSTVEAGDGFLGLFGRPARESACECARSNNMSLGHALSLINGPTVGDAIADDANELTSLVQYENDDAKLIDELFVRILSRPPNPEQLALFTAELDTSALAAIDALQPDARAQLIEQRAAWEAALPRITWAPCEAGSIQSASEATIEIQDDDSFLLTSERPDKDTYSVSLWTDLDHISGLRLETYTGASDSGNFVLADIQLTIQALDSAAPQTITFSQATADFSQSDWNIAGAIDEDPASGWGIHPQRDTRHQAVFAFAEPAQTPGGAHLLIRMSQPHGSAHVIRHFRFAVTAATGDIRWLDLPDALQAALAQAPDERSPADRATLHARFMATVPELAKTIRLQAVRDIAWALINSPAFLYNR